MPGSGLPPSARLRLSGPLRVAARTAVPFGESHTLPAAQAMWRVYVDGLTNYLQRLSALVVKGPELSEGFAPVRSWVNDSIETYQHIVSVMLALQPFEYFNSDDAQRVINLICKEFIGWADYIEGNFERMCSEDIARIDASWLTPSSFNNDETLACAFGMTDDDVRDESGEFSPGKVLSKHYLKLGGLLDRTYSHMTSLGLPVIQDPLVAISVVGWICSAEDNVHAFCAMNALFSRLVSADAAVVELGLAYLSEAEPALRQGRRRVNRALTLAATDDDLEEKSFVLADVYKRLVEGPIRRYGWLYHSLKCGVWLDPPMLSQVRDVLLSQGGWISDVAQQMILTDIRNGEAHEHLVWDGVREVFVAGTAAVDLPVVLRAAVLGDAFARGCQAAVACYRALSIVPTAASPSLDDVGRLEAWRRAEAFFGTNGLEIVRANFNSKIAKVTCSSLEEGNINPCFQALVCCHMLLPHVLQFDVSSARGLDEAKISVSSDALNLTLPVWETAARLFTSMPLCTFLPANLNARQRSEELSKAVRSIAWIALDDLLDALDGTPQCWNAADFELFMNRVKLNALALDQCVASISKPTPFRLATLHAAVREFIREIEIMAPPVEFRTFECLELVERFRAWWNAWGPVERLPGFPPAETDFPSDHRPALRHSVIDLRWSTI
jgi:hypothetical protein